MTKMMNKDCITSSAKYKEVVTEMSSVKDKPICVFVFYDLNMPNRIQTMSIVAAEELQSKGAGKITIADFNNRCKSKIG